MFLLEKLFPWKLKPGKARMAQEGYLNILHAQEIFIEKGGRVRDWGDFERVEHRN